MSARRMSKISLNLVPLLWGKVWSANEDVYQFIGNVIRKNDETKKPLYDNRVVSPPKSVMA